MGMVPELIENASFEAHMAASELIATALGIEQAKPADVAHALAHAYGEALGIYAMTGADSEQIEALGRIANRASEAMVSRICATTCEGRA